MDKIRLDIMLTERGLVESRSLAQRLVMAGQVRVNDQVVLKPAEKFVENVNITIDAGPPFVSRGGEKLQAALLQFNLDQLDGWICVDVGSSTGGFTDCLLQHGAVKVFAVDVGYGVLHWKLRNDPRVISMEKTNARFIDSFHEPIQLVTVDASFISLKVLLPVIKSWFVNTPGKVVALIKPQFEAGREEVAKGEGVVRNPDIHKKVLNDLLSFADREDFGLSGLIRSPLVGPKGNAEFLAYLQLPKIDEVDIQQMVERIFQ
jgi:23S rRNA (cytidine1920-2'-O)/16S rRNA (cytidine1409-2'-O)-methyltransferase